MNKELIEFVAELLEKTSKYNLHLIDEKEINYGVQLKFARENNEIPLNIYVSKKKGISTVIGGSPVNKLRPVLQKLLDKEITQIGSEHDWEKWAGTDESGKGDFFGPLVVCGFILDKKKESEFKNLGVKDSKDLSDKQIETIAKKLYKYNFNNIEVIILNPEKYNELYLKFRDQNKKLNELLAWMHGRVILNLNRKHNFEGAVVDKFTGNNTLLSSLKDLKNINLIHRIKAEDDIAVASASIIARYHFLLRINDLSKKFGLEFPKGSSEKVIEIGKKFTKKYGKERLREVAKTHFKTINLI